MQRGVRADATGTMPGVFETIATAMSLLLMQPLLLALPLAADLLLWLGVRITPAALVEPLLTVVSTQGSAEAALLVESLQSTRDEGNLLELIGWFVPSLVGTLGSQALAAPWARGAVSPGGAGGAVLIALGLLVVGGVVLMTLEVMMARVVRGGAPLGGGTARMVLAATLRYVGFMALLVPALLLAIIGGAMVTGVLALLSAGLASLAVMVLLAVFLVGAVLLTFVVDAIALAEVGPTRAVELSVGIVRRYPWASVGLLLVSAISLLTLPEIGRQLIAGSVAGALIAMVIYAFIATGLALARMQFFADRLRHWQPGLVRSAG